MIYSPTNRFGLDVELKAIQDAIHKRFTNAQDKFDVYGQLVKVDRNGELVLMYQAGSEYKEVLLNDTKTGVVGFYANPVRDLAGDKHLATVDVIFTVKAADLVGEANNEKMYLAAEKVLSGNLGITPDKLKVGVDEVFREVNKERLIFRDLFPFTVFSFQFKIQYSQNLNC